jgi:hypothetical protein
MRNLAGLSFGGVHIFFSRLGNNANGEVYFLQYAMMLVRSRLIAINHLVKENCWGMAAGSLRRPPSPSDRDEPLAHSMSRALAQIFVVEGVHAAELQRCLRNFALPVSILGKHKTTDWKAVERNGAL